MRKTNIFFARLEGTGGEKNILPPYEKVKLVVNFLIALFKYSGFPH